MFLDGREDPFHRKRLAHLRLHRERLGYAFVRVSLELLGRSSAVVYQSLGRGHVIGFADDPNFRAFSPDTQRLFQNAVFLSPGR